MKYLILGIGNKGEKYENTRHNIGFKIVEKVAEKIEAKFSSANYGWTAEGKYKGRKIILLKPDTYVNLSGNALKFWMQKENIPLEKGAVIVADRFYNDFPMLSIWDSKGVFFVIRHKENLKFETLQERELPPKGAQNILKDEDIILSNPISKEKYML